MHAFYIGDTGVVTNVLYITKLACMWKNVLQATLSNSCVCNLTNNCILYLYVLKSESVRE